MVCSVLCKGLWIHAEGLGCEALHSVWAGWHTAFLWACLMLCKQNAMLRILCMCHVLAPWLSGEGLCMSGVAQGSSLCLLSALQGAVLECTWLYVLRG